VYTKSLVPFSSKYSFIINRVINILFLSNKHKSMKLYLGVRLAPPGRRGEAKGPVVDPAVAKDGGAG